ncbi:MAG: SDR family NAD(P)-dependent oxidoreductase, partial [Luminiphilus sp.]
MTAEYFRNKKALITGAGDGIGRALAQQLNSVGCQLWLCDIDADRLQGTVDTLSASKTPVSTRIVDCGSREAIQNWAGEVAGETDVLDAVFNNAGVAYGAYFADANEDTFQWLMAINYWGVV